MARITKAQSRKRLMESVIKINKVHQGYHLSPTDNTKLYKICQELMRIADNKLR